MEDIKHSLILTGVPGGNGQVERLNRTLTPLLTKLCAPKPGDWYKYLVVAQQYLNAVLHRSIGVSPFRLLVGVDPRVRDDSNIKSLLQNKQTAIFQDDRDDLRRQARESTEKVQRENRRQYNKTRREAFRYCEGDLVAIRITQQASGLKLAHKYLVTYEIIKVLRNDRYLVRKIDEHEGPT